MALGGEAGLGRDPRQRRRRLVDQRAGARDAALLDAGVRRDAR
jgi:hypothetical protein